MRISQRRIKAGIKLIAYINSHGMYCKWVSVKWHGADYEIIETKYTHMNCNKLTPYRIPERVFEWKGSYF